MHESKHPFPDDSQKVHRGKLGQHGEAFGPLQASLDVPSASLQDFDSNQQI